MKKLQFFLLVLPLVSFAQQVDLNLIKGTVSDNSTPLTNVFVSTSTTNNSAVTDKDGKYSIKAAIGEKIYFTILGMESVEIIVEDVTRILNITMYPKTEMLDEVTVTKRKSKLKSQKELEREYATNKRLVQTTFGIIDPDMVGGTIRVLAEGQVMPADPCFLNLLKTRLPGVTAVGNCVDGGTVYVRGGNQSFLESKGAIYDVDGQILTSPPLWLNAFTIKRIAVLVGASTRAKYGVQGFGGVVVINTLSGPQYIEGQDLGILSNNFYDNSALSQQNLMEDAPNYLKELYASTTVEEAKEVFQNYLSKYSGSYYYFIDSYRYFMEQANETFAESLIQQHFERFNDNPVALKSLAYVYDSFQEYIKSNVLYKEVFNLRPNYGQSYMDLANSYRNIGNYQKAVSLYTRYEYLLDTGIISDEKREFSNLMDIEMNNLIALKGDNLMSNKNLQEYTLEDDFHGTKFVFEWADSEAEFELQFVNPENQYFKWNHTLIDNPKRIQDEKKLGYSVTEQLIYDSFTGAWKVNVNYFGNKSLTPTYLKATIYYNYGKPSQTNEIKVFKLSLRNVNQQLFTVFNMAGLVSN